MSTGRRRVATRASTAALAAVVLAIAAAGCGSETDAGAETERPDEVVPLSEPQDPISPTIGGSVASLAQCRDWNEATKKQKLATIEDIRSQLHPQSPGVEAPELTDDEALEVFNNACSESYAKGFRLYVLYARAVGFAPLARELEGE